VIYGVDVSAYQPSFDFAACRREGFDFAIIKSTEGTGWKSSYFATQLRQARAAGLLVAAYHYVRGSDVSGQLANIRSMVGVDVPVILDVEDGAGSIGSIRELNAALNRAGYRTPLIYIPRWYWSGAMGSPDLRGLPPNWHSRYPDNTVRRKEGFALGPEYWPSFGGLHTEIAQFTSSLAVANYPNGRIDGNAYRGTREQLAALLGGEEEDMATGADVWNEKIESRNYAQDGYKPEAKAWLLGADYNAGQSWATALRVEAKLDLLANQISDDEANVIAAVRAQKAVVDMTDEQVQALLSGLTAQTKEALKAALREGTDA
jgi:lysozyme